MMETKAPIHSEMVEPAMGYILSRLWAQCEEAKERNDGDLEDACFYLWLGIKAINRLSFCCGRCEPHPVHFSIAASNEQGRIADYINEVLGFNPWHDKDHPVAKRWNSV